MNPEPTSSESAPDPCHLFVDEAGTPDIFDAKGRINIGKPGCSRFGPKALKKKKPHV